MKLWGYQITGLLSLCNAQYKSNFPAILSTIATLSKEHVQAAMESVFRAHAKCMHFHDPRVPHYIAVMMLAI